MFNNATVARFSPTIFDPILNRKHSFPANGNVESFLDDRLCEDQGRCSVYSLRGQLTREDFRRNRCFTEIKRYFIEIYIFLNIDEEEGLKKRFVLCTKCYNDIYVGHFVCLCIFEFLTNV